MSRLAIIIPYFGNAKHLEDTLVSVLENRPEGSEILVALSETYDNPYALDDELTFVSAPARTGFSASVNLALARTEAPIVHVLSCGTEVTEDWVDAALAPFADSGVAAVAPLVLKLGDRDRVLAAGVEYCRGGRSRLLEHGRRSILVDRAAAVLAPHPAAAFYRRSALERIGRFPKAMGGLLATLDVALTFRRLGLRTVLAPESQVASSASAGSGAFVAAMEAERFYWRWAGCAECGGGLIAHLLHASADCLRGIRDLSIFARLAGRLVGLCRGGGSRSHAARLRKLEESASPEPVAPPRVAPRRDAASAPALRAPHLPGANGRAPAPAVRKAR